MNRDAVQRNMHSSAIGNGTGNLEHITTSHADFPKARAEDVRHYVKNGWTSGIDYNSLFGNGQVLVLGDTDHRQHAVLGGLESEMRSMKEAGVNDVAFEMPDGKKYLESLEAFYATGDVSPIRWICEQTRTPVRLVRFLKRAYEEGIRVHFVDLPEEEYDPNWNHKQESEQRGIHMGKRIADIAKQSGRRVVAIAGYAHLDNKQIPDQLDEQGVSYKKIGLVSAGQPLPMMIIQHTYELGASEAVRNEGLYDRVGTVNLDGTYGLDAFIHFSRVQLVDPNGKEVNGEPSVETSVKAISSEGALVPLQSGANLTALISDMRHDVEPESSLWEKTNMQKIFQFINRMYGLSNGQKLYLGIMLENYVRLTLRHGGGSIFKMEYDPEARAFGVDTVDTYGYPMSPDADYGSLARHREVTLETLLNQFGFSELVVKRVEDLPRTNVRPNPDKPESAYKVLLLASTYATDPERILLKGGWLGVESIIVAHKDKQSYIVNLGVDDFALSNVESMLSGIKNRMDEANSLVGDMIYAVGQVRDSMPRRQSFRYFHNKKLDQMKGGLGTLSELISKSLNPNINNFRFGFPERILRARVDLEYLSNDSALDYISTSEDGFRKAVQTVDEIDRIGGKYEQLSLRIFTRVGNPFTFKYVVQRNRDLLNESLRELSKLRELLQEDQATTPRLEERTSLF